MGSLDQIALQAIEISKAQARPYEAGRMVEIFRDSDPLAPVRGACLKCSLVRVTAGQPALGVHGGKHRETESLASVTPKHVQEPSAAALGARVIPDDTRAEGQVVVGSDLERKIG